MSDPLISIRTLPTSSLLGLLVGDVAAEALAGRSLAELFHLHARQTGVCETPADYRAVRILGAARELLTRALAEAVELGDCLDSPQKVRDLLRLRFGSLPHEVFGVVLDRVPGRGVRSVSRSGRRVIVSGLAGERVRLRLRTG